MRLREYQKDAVQSMFDYFEAGHSGHPAIVMPTGTGKSLVIAAAIQQVLRDYPTARVLMLTHVKELIQQNLDKLLRVWPEAPIGVYSAGLKQANTDRSILFCGIQSVWNKAKALASKTRPIELVFVDECHRVPLHDDGTYRRFIRDLLAFNPHMRLIGLTATPFRHVPATQTHSGGYQTITVGDDRIFTDICFDLTPALANMIDDAYLAPLWPQPTDYQVDLKGIKIERGDYQADQLNRLMEKHEVIDAILDEAISLARADGRQHWLVFCAGVDAARNLTASLNARGVLARVVDGDTPARDRDGAICDFRAGRLTALVSVGVLTTGFDAPITDCLIVARPTLSPVLYVQMMGRGMRPTEAKIAVEGGRKRGCLVLDFCGNVDRHGPIDRLRLKGPALKKAEPMKTCPRCEKEIRVFANPCPECGHEFPVEDRFVETPTAGNTAIIASLDPPAPPVRYEVSRVTYAKHVGASGIPSLRVDYFSGFLRVASEWVCVQHAGYARQKAMKWWMDRMREMPPNDLDSAIKRLNERGFKQPTAVFVRLGRTARDYDEIVKFEWPEVAA